MVDRRTFIAAASAFAMSAASRNAFSSARPEQSFIFDAMGELRTTYPSSLIKDMRASGINAITVTLTDPKVQELQAYEEGKTAVLEHDRFIEKHPDLLLKATKSSDLQRAMNENKIAVYYLFQNSTQFGRDLSRLDEFYDAGVTSSQLTYNYQNWVGAGCKELRGSGLTVFGATVVEKMNEIGMLIDLSHSKETTMLDAIEASNQPIIISHTACQAVFDNIRNTSDKALKAMAEKGGVVGICQIRPFITHSRPDVALPEYFDHIDHAVKVAGIEHVSIGSDRDHRVITMTDEYLAELAREEGENFDMKEWPLFIDELNGPRRMEVIWDGLKDRKYSDDQVEKIMGQNLQKLYNTVIG